MTTWFRLYAEVVDDPKVQKLPSDDFRSWINLLCLATKNGGRLPPIEDICFSLRMPENGVVTLLERLSNGGLIDKCNGGPNGWHYAPHAWSKRQYKSDNSTERVKRFRQRSATVSEAPPETETDTDKRDTNVSLSTPSASATKRGTRIPDGWTPTEPDFERGESLGLTRKEIEDAAVEFSDYWGGRSRDALKLDWGKTFRARLAEIARRKPSSRQTRYPDANANGSKPVGMAGIVARRRRQAEDQPAFPYGEALRQG